MPPDEVSQFKSIDEAILACEKHIKSHRNSAAFTIGTVIMIISVTIALSFLGSMLPKTVIINHTKSADNNISNIKQVDTSNAIQETTTNIPYPIEQYQGYSYARDNAFSYSNALVVGFFGFCALFFSVIISIYRFHLREITKNEQLKLGFMRIRIAANNSTEGFDSDVRKSLVESAFYVQRDDNFTIKKNKVENPMPGHPISDLSTVLINKILEGIDIKIESKASKSKE